MDNHQMMLFHLTQQMTRDSATHIANMYKLPASTVDEIDRKNPGMVLVRALEQRLIICKDVNKLREFHRLLKTMNYNDLATILEDCYVELKEEANVPQSPPSQNVHNPVFQTPVGEITTRGDAVMSPASMQASPPSQNVNQPVSRTPVGETTDRGDAVMPPASMQGQQSSAKPGETTHSGNVVTNPSGN